jgi:hypothetical protein
MASKSIGPNTLTAFSVILFVGSIIYLLKRSILEHSADIDFRFIWTAGKLWALGVDPYSPRFTALGRAMFPTGNDIAYWLYPPQWWAISRPLAAFSVEKALAIWRGFNAVLLIAASLALALAVRRVRPETPPWAVVLLIAVMSLMEGTAQTLMLGQTSIMVFSGFCLMGLALLASRQGPMVAGLVLLLLKPQFAVPIIVCLVITRKWRLPVVIALAVTGLASLPQIMHFGLLPTLKGMLGNMALHGQLSSNRPENLIGFSHLVWWATGASLSNAADIALDFIATMALGLMICRRHGLDERDGAALGISLIACGMFFLPLHEYDTVALGPIAMLAIVLNGVPRYLAWAAVAMALRPGIISAQFGNRETGDPLLLSLAGLLALIAAVSAVVTQLKSRSEA